MIGREESEARGAATTALREHPAEESRPRRVPGRSELEARLHVAHMAGDDAREETLLHALVRHPLTSPCEAAAHRARALELRVSDETIALSTRSLLLAQAAYFIVCGQVADAWSLIVTLGPADDPAAFRLALDAAWRTARSGDPDAQMLYGELADFVPTSVEPRRRLALVQAGAGDAAAEAWLDVLSRLEPQSSEAMLALARAFDASPRCHAAAAGFAGELEIHGRFDAADELWREHSAHAGTTHAIALQRMQAAGRRGDHGAALAAAIDASITAPSTEAHGDEAMRALATDTTVLAEFGIVPDQERPFERALCAAARTKSAMGRADALTKLAARIAGAPRAVLLTFAAEAYTAAGNGTRAARAARRARALAPLYGRAHAALLAVVPAADLSSAELEAACACLPPRVSTWRASALQFTREGHGVPALIAWRRAAELRPSDSALGCTALLQAVSSAVPEHLHSSIIAALDVPVLDAALECAIADAIDRLSALALPRALAIVDAYQSSIAYGSRIVTAAMLRCAEIAKASPVALAILALRATATTDKEERASLTLLSAELSLRTGAIAEAAYFAVAAVKNGVGAAQLVAIFKALAAEIPKLSGSAEIDARIGFAIAKAELADAEAQVGTASAVVAEERFRELAALTWELAHDRFSAENALFRACAHAAQAAPSDAARAYVQELHSLVGEHTFALVRRRTDNLLARDPLATVGPFFLGIARLARDSGDLALALELAVSAVTADAACSAAVTLVEELTTAPTPREIDALETVYDTLAARALGRFGTHAAHYRCAIQLERIGARQRSLVHACSAYCAVPVVACARLIERIAGFADDGAAAAARALVASRPSANADDAPSESNEADLLRHDAVRHERGRRLLEAGMTWLRASKVALTVEEKLADMTRSCETLFAAGDLGRAEKLLATLEAVEPSPTLSRLRIDVDRARAEHSRG
ncbi:MAG: hypothetical protein EXR75_05720 [Myxococcales bacterium]|nr:hypothetical protein [Myxococcales bacterium]